MNIKNNFKKLNKLTALGLSILFGLTMLTTMVCAHQELDVLPESSQRAQAAISWRTKGAVAENSTWHIPGVTLGGDALPPEEGLNLDDLQLLSHFRVEKYYSVSTKLSAHSHSGESDINLENYWLTYDAQLLLPSTLVEIGRMNTEVSKTAYFHASESNFSEASMLSDVFFGRHFNDLGVKVKTQKDNITFGFEAWSGSAWPAANRQGAQSAFFRVEPNWRSNRIELNIWAMNAEAMRRRDLRYDGGHDHNNTVETDTSNIAYDGKTQMWGIQLSNQGNLGPIAALIEGEIIQANLAGTLYDDIGQQSGLDSTYEGVRVMLGLTLKDHSLHYQYEQLVMENIFLNSVNQSAFLVVILDYIRSLSPGCCYGRTYLILLF